MGNSLKTNFVFNLINVVSGLLFPLITFPYVTRVLMAEGLGQVQFYSSIINYIVLFSSLGIPMYGIRQIARVRDDAKELAKTTVELFSLNLALTIFGYIIIAILCLEVGKIQVNIPLFLILSATIIINTVGCSWFYSGIEEFKFITVRNLLVKIASIVFLFVFVIDQTDILWYGVYTILVAGGNNIWNFLCLRKYVDLHIVSLSEINIKKHIKPTLEVFIFNLVTSIYLNLDTVMLGFIKDSESVGYYTAATKLSHIMVTIVTSLGTVMLPRLSNLFEAGDEGSFNMLSRKSYEFIVLLAFPITAGLILMAPILIQIFCGPLFSCSIQTLRIISPVVIAIGISNLIGLQILYPKGKTNLVILSTAIGAVVNFILNLILIPKYAQNGAAIATVTAEFSVTLAQMVFAGKYIPFKIITKHSHICFISAIIMSICCSIIENIGISDIWGVFVIPFVGALIYAIMMLITKDSLALEIKTTICSKLLK